LWSIDPDYKERDGANNVVEKKYSMGKRVAFWRFMGRDWSGRKMRGWMLENVLKDGASESEEFGVMDEEEMMATLSKRLLELEINRTEVAGCEQRLAVRRGEIMNSVVVDEEYSDFADAMNDGIEVQMLNEVKERLEVAETSLEELVNAMDDKLAKGASFLPFSLPWEKSKTLKRNSKPIRPTLYSILSRFDKQLNDAPYRGAIGYPPKVDSQDDVHNTHLPTIFCSKSLMNN
jgi:hypothetical protein